MDKKESLLENEIEKKERIKKEKEYPDDTTSYEGSDDFRS